jgi:hypothetical protein
MAAKKKKLGKFVCFLDNLSVIIIKIEKYSEINENNFNNKIILFSKKGEV